MNRSSFSVFGENSLRFLRKPILWCEVKLFIRDNMYYNCMSFLLLLQNWNRKQLKAASIIYCTIPINRDTIKWLFLFILNGLTFTKKRDSFFFTTYQNTLLLAYILCPHVYGSASNNSLSTYYYLLFVVYVCWHIYFPMHIQCAYIVFNKKKFNE